MAMAAHFPQSASRPVESSALPQGNDKEEMEGTPMRVIRNLTGTLLVAGLASMAYAWAPRSAAAPTNRPETASAAQQDQTPPKQEQKPPKAEKQQVSPKQPEKAEKNQQKEEKAQPKSAQNGQGQAAGSHGRISDSAYKSHFGQSHTFTIRRVITTTRVIPNQTQFVYGGYTFIFLAPWPSEWVMTDDCYIDYVDGEYVIIDVAHPGMTVALEIAG
jgi:hypothetical protein